MIAEIAFNNSFLESWGERMFAASWQGGTLLVLAWMICSVWKPFPAATRCWIWRLAYFKFAIVLLFGGLMQLPILPSSFEFGNPFESASRLEQASGQLEGLAAIQRPITESANMDSIRATTLISSVDRIPSEAGGTWLFYVLPGIWIVGCGWGIVNVLRHQLMAKKLVANSTPFENEKFIRCYRVQCAQLKLSRPPALATTTEIKSPILVGAIRPTILLPQSVTRSCDTDELSLIVAHELAHTKRRDLLWNWLPVLVRTCFFFHPLVWLAQSCFALDQEIACDSMALNWTKAKSKTYANVLVKVSSKNSPRCTPSLAALGVASSFKSLKSRILEMNQFKYPTTQITQLFSVTIVTLGLFLIAPFALVAQQEKSEGKEVADVRDKAATGTSQQTVVRSKRLRQSIGSATETDIKDGTNDSSNRTASAGNISISVSDGNKEESLKVKSNPDGGVVVTFSNVVDGNKNIKKYTLANIEHLAEKDKQAYEFYKKHVTDAADGSNGIGLRFSSGTNGISGQGISGLGSMRRSPSQSTRSGSDSDQSSDSSSQSSSSSAWQRSTSFSRNGKTRNSQSSGTTGNGIVGNGVNGVGDANQQMINQINQMIDQTDNAQMKASLRQLLDQMKNK